jgi:hypothetical protein
MPWYQCIVNQVGPAIDGTETPAPVLYINLTDTAGSFKNTWFYAAAGGQDQMLNVGISAINSKKNVEVAATAPNAGGSPYTELTRLYEIVGTLPPTPPAAPSGLHVISKQAAAGPGASSITIGWTDNSDNEAGFNITYDGSLPGGPDDKGKKTVSGNSTTATISGLTSGYTYVIEVQSFNAAGNSGITYISVGIPYVAPPAPRVITVSKQGTGSAASAMVSGSGFSPNSLIVIRIVAANLLSPVQFSTTAGGDGKFSASKSFSCVSGIVITFTAFEDANPTGTISNAVSMTC